MTEGMSVYSLMQTGKPYKSYIKTVLGKVYVNVWDSFENKKVGLIIEGIPIPNQKNVLLMYGMSKRMFTLRGLINGTLKLVL